MYVHACLRVYVCVCEAECPLCWWVQSSSQGHTLLGPSSGVQIPALLWAQDPTSPASVSLSVNGNSAALPPRVAARLDESREAQNSKLRPARAASVFVHLQAHVCLLKDYMHVTFSTSSHVCPQALLFTLGDETSGDKIKSQNRWQIFSRQALIWEERVWLLLGDKPG